MTECETQGFNIRERKAPGDFFIVEIIYLLFEDGQQS